MSTAPHFDHEAEKIFERMRIDLEGALALRIPPGVKPSPDELVYAALQVIAREIAEHRLRTGST